MRLWWAILGSNLYTPGIDSPDASLKPLDKWDFRTLNDLQAEGFEPPSHTQLAALFEARIRERGQTWNMHDGAGIGLESGTVETMADDAAVAALRDWSEEWISQRRKAGRLGGTRSKRPASWDTDDLAVLALFAHLPTRDAFLHYNAWRSQPRSRATVYRMLQALREQHPYLMKVFAPKGR